jgi:hypothetical protein
MDISSSSSYSQGFRLCGPLWSQYNSPEVSLNLNSVNRLIFVMVKCGVLFEVRTGFFVFKGLNLNSVNQLIFVMVKCCVLFEVRTKFLTNI